MIVRGPGRVPAGRVEDQVWAMWDFLPTACDLVDRPVPPGLDGLSMLPLIEGRPQISRHEYLYWEFHEKGFRQAVRTGDWKAVRPGAGQPLELYNLKTDLGEQKNVAGDHPEIIARIETYLKTARTESEHWPVRATR
jgi:arylsulfatase A-like enzyme